jgi:hypothetical protein
MDISGDLLRYGKKDTTPAAHPAKIKVRRNVLEEIGAEGAHVFDAFAGEGEMYRSIWNEAKSYVGCDKQLFNDDRPAFQADNRRVLRAIDLTRYNIFDLDAHGSMWEQVYIIAVRRPVASDELLGLVITEGLGLKMNMGGISKPLSKIARIKTNMPGMGAMRGEVIERALNQVCRMMHCEVVRRWQATGKKGSRVDYIGLVLRGLPIEVAA